MAMSTVWREYILSVICSPMKHTSRLGNLQNFGKGFYSFAAAPGNPLIYRQQGDVDYPLRVEENFPDLVHSNAYINDVRTCLIQPCGWARNKDSPPKTAFSDELFRIVMASIRFITGRRVRKEFRAMPGFRPTAPADPARWPAWFGGHAEPWRPGNPFHCDDCVPPEISVKTLSILWSKESSQWWVNNRVNPTLKSFEHTKCTLVDILASSLYLGQQAHYSENLSHEISSVGVPKDENS
jgi:hypothetical protein